MTSDELVVRARSQIGLGIAYKLGRGGMNPKNKTCASVMNQCDCTGFLAWSLGVSRKTDNPWYREMNGGWLESTAIERDCATPFGFFDTAGGDAKPGMVLVYGDTRTGHGHVGIVSEVKEGLPVKVIHCSKGNFIATGDAIQETSPAVFFKAKALVASCAFIEYTES